MEPPQFRRAVMGYERKAVDGIISDRDSMLASAQRRIRAAEEEIAGLQRELGNRDETIDALRMRVESLERDVAEIAASASAQEPVSPAFVTGELQRVVAAAEESAARILERAETSTRDRILQADRVWQEVQGEARRFREWREALEPTAAEMAAQLERAWRDLGDVPQRVQDLFSQSLQSISAAQDGLASFLERATPPASGMAAAPVDREVDPAEEWPTGFAPSEDQNEGDDMVGEAPEGVSAVPQEDVGGGLGEWPGEDLADAIASGTEWYGEASAETWGEQAAFAVTEADPGSNGHWGAAASGREDVGSETERPDQSEQSEQREQPEQPEARYPEDGGLEGSTAALLALWERHDDDADDADADHA